MDGFQGLISACAKKRGDKQTRQPAASASVLLFFSFSISVMVTVYFALNCSFDGAVNRTTVGNESVAAIAGVFVAQKRISNAKEGLFSAAVFLNNIVVSKSQMLSSTG